MSTFAPKTLYPILCKHSLTSVRHLALVEAVVGLEVVLVSVLLVLGRLAVEPGVEVVVLVVVLLPGTPHDRGRRRPVVVPARLVIVPAEDAAVVLEGELLARQELLLAGVAPEALGVKDLLLGAHHELVLVEGPKAFVALGPEQSAEEERTKMKNKGRWHGSLSQHSAIARSISARATICNVCLHRGWVALPPHSIHRHHHALLFGDEDSQVGTASVCKCKERSSKLQSVHHSCWSYVSVTKTGHPLRRWI